MFLSELDPKIFLACCLAGFVGILYEVLRPGAVLPGVLGLAAELAGFYGIRQLSPNRSGIAWLFLSLLLFAVEAAWGQRFLAGVLATAALATGLRELFGGPAKITFSLAIAIAAAVGVMTVWLLAVAKIAWRNKVADL